MLSRPTNLPIREMPLPRCQEAARFANVEVDGVLKGKHSVLLHHQLLPRLKFFPEARHVCKQLLNT